MFCGKINIDLDKKINEFANKQLKENINVSDYVKKIVELAIMEDKIETSEVCVSILSATKNQIKDINKKYRGIDKITDVLSFPIFSKEELEDIKSKEDNKRIQSIELGDIIICLDIVKVQAIEYGTGFKRELLYMITHGICHLLGYDHIVDEDKTIMRKMEEKILSKIEVDKVNG